MEIEAHQSMPKILTTTILKNIVLVLNENRVIFFLKTLIEGMNHGEEATNDG